MYEKKRLFSLCKRGTLFAGIKQNKARHANPMMGFSGPRPGSVFNLSSTPRSRRCPWGSLRVTTCQNHCAFVDPTPIDGPKFVHLYRCCMCRCSASTLCKSRQRRILVQRQGPSLSDDLSASKLQLNFCFLFTCSQVS